MGTLDRPSPALSAAIAERAIARRFARGQELMYEGQVADRVLLIRSGRVKISAVTPAGREVVLAFRGPGDLIGELAALDETPRSATVRAIEPVEAFALTHDDFLKLLQDPALSMALLRVLSWRLRDADAKRVEFAAFDAMGRVAVRLVELSERFGEPEGDGIRIELPLSQEELAAWTGSSLESVGRALQSMRALGWIETGRRVVRLLDPAAVRNAAR